MDGLILNEQARDLHSLLHHVSGPGLLSTVVELPESLLLDPALA